MQTLPRAAYMVSTLEGKSKSGFAGVSGTPTKRINKKLHVQPFRFWLQFVQVDLHPLIPLTYALCQKSYILAPEWI